MHVILSALPRVKAVSVNFRAAASGSSSVWARDTASWTKHDESTCQLQTSRATVYYTSKRTYNSWKTQKAHFMFIGWIFSIHQVNHQSMKCVWACTCKCMCPLCVVCHREREREREKESAGLTSLGTTSHSPSLASTINSISSSISWSWEKRNINICWYIFVTSNLWQQ